MTSHDQTQLFGRGTAYNRVWTVYNSSFAIVNWPRDTLQYCKLSRGHFCAGDSLQYYTGIVWAKFVKYSTNISFIIP